MSLKNMDVLSLDDGNLLIAMGLLAYTIIDKDSFYDIKKHEKAQVDNWNDDVVTGKKETDLLFFPEVHKLVVKKSSKIALKRVLQYLKEALDIIEPESFDVNVVNDRDTINKIVNAESIYRIEANVSYSNPGNTEGFQKIFEKKTRGANPDKMSIKLEGTSENPLVCEDDGLIPCLANMAEQDGTIKAVIQEGEKKVTIDSKDHPKVISVQSSGRDWLKILETKLKSLCGK
jgi:hypothetical protein